MIRPQGLPPPCLAVTLTSLCVDMPHAHLAVNPPPVNTHTRVELTVLIIQWNP